MTITTQIPVVAIDGGGTRCRVALARPQGVISVETGSANVSTDFDGAVSQILAGLDAVAERGDCTLQVLCGLPAYVGLAGVTGPDMAARLRAALPFERVQIADDRPASLRGALGKDAGVVAHFGTGSFFAAQINGDIRFSGGWGPVLGDEASAQWLGRYALRHVLAVADGLAEETPLTQHLLRELGGTAGIVRFAATTVPSGIGAIAPQITHHASEGDPAALLIMRAGVDEITRTLTAIGWEPGHALCLTGGLGPHYGPYLPDAPGRALIAPKSGPLDGAIALAREFAGGGGS